MLDTKCRKFLQPLINIGADFFIKLGFSANKVTVIALILGALSGVFIYLSMPITSIVFLWLSGYLDAVDGTIARIKGSTYFGTVMDVTFDRVVEIIIIIGVALSNPNQRLNLVILASCIILSMTIFLTTGIMLNKISDKSFYYQTGLAERTEGFVMFSFMIFFKGYLTLIISVFSIMILITAAQRFIEAKKILNIK